jgi:dTMP kinase
MPSDGSVGTEQPMRGLLIAFEGLDQSGKQTQAERVRDRLVASGRVVELLSFPAYHTPIGFEIRQALEGTRRWRADVMQLLYIANRYEAKARIEDALARGTIVVCDRYVASSVAYGESQGLDAEWLHDIQRHLPQPDLTILLDIAPEVSAQRKTAGRDAYERDLALLARVRVSYLNQAHARGWLLLDASRDRERIASEIFDALEPLLR